MAMNSFMRSTPISADQMHRDRQAWEDAIAVYQGPDPLDHWYNYVCWYENHGHGDPENKFRETLERCLTQYEHNDYYKQDTRMTRLWLKYIDMQSNPLHFYQVLYQRGVGRQVAAFYISWAGYYESIHAFKEAESVYTLAFQEKAESAAELHHAYNKFAYTRNSAAAAVTQQKVIAAQTATSATALRAGSSSESVSGVASYHQPVQGLTHVQQVHPPQSPSTGVTPHTSGGGYRHAPALHGGNYTAYHHHPQQQQHHNHNHHQHQQQQHPHHPSQHPVQGVYQTQQPHQTQHIGGYQPPISHHLHNHNASAPIEQPLPATTTHLEQQQQHHHHLSQHQHQQFNRQIQIAHAPNPHVHPHHINHLQSQQQQHQHISQQQQQHLSQQQQQQLHAQQQHVIASAQTNSESMTSSAAQYVVHTQHPATEQQLPVNGDVYVSNLQHQNHQQQQQHQHEHEAVVQHKHVEEQELQQQQQIIHYAVATEEVATTSAPAITTDGLLHENVKNNEEECATTSSANTIDGIRLPKRFAAYCRNNYETWKPALFLEEPPDPCRRCNYAKHLVYPGNDTEYSPEELRARRFGVFVKSTSNVLEVDAAEQQQQQQETLTNEVVHHEFYGPHQIQEQEELHHHHFTLTNAQRLDEQHTDQQQSVSYVLQNGLGVDNVHEEEPQERTGAEYRHLLAAQRHNDDDGENETPPDDQDDDDDQNDDEYEQDDLYNTNNNEADLSAEAIGAGDADDDVDDDDDDDDDDDEDDNNDVDNYPAQVGHHNLQVPTSYSNNHHHNNHARNTTTDDLENQIEASTIHFSQNKTIKIKFKKDRSHNSNALNGEGGPAHYNYSSYTVENISQQEITTPTTVAADAYEEYTSVRRNGYSFHPYNIGQTSTPKTSSKRSKTKLKRASSKYQAMTGIGSSSNSSGAGGATHMSMMGATASGGGVGGGGRTLTDIGCSGIAANGYEAATFNDNANYSFSSAAALENSNCSISSAVDRLNFRDNTTTNLSIANNNNINNNNNNNTTLGATTTMLNKTHNAADFSTFQENSYFATQHDSEAKELRLKKALLTIERHLAKDAIDPFNSELCRAFLTRLDFPGSEENMHDNYKIVQTPLPKLSMARTLALPDVGGVHFNIDKEVGRGSYGSVYKATDVNSGAVVALKYQKPPNTWEIYICDQVLKRVRYPNILPGLMDVSTAIIAPNASLIATEFSPFGSLLDINNKIRQNTSKVMHESLVMHFASQICNIVRHLHEQRIIHADIKPDNFLLMRIPSSDSNCPSLRLIDFGCAIDMTLFPDPDNTKFRKVIQTDGFTCIEMQEGRPWSYETDLFCIAGTVHVMLFGEYMQLQKQRDSKWDIKQKLPRYLKKHVWTRFFGDLLNIHADGEKLPDLHQLQELFELEAAKMDSELQKQIRALSNILYRR